MKKRTSDGRGGEVLPAYIPNEIRRERITTTRFGGLTSMGNGYGDSLFSMSNLSPRCAPALATRKKHGVFFTSRVGGTPHGMTMFGDVVVFAQGSGLYCVDRKDQKLRLIGNLSDTDKQFYVFGERLYIFPDKVYLEEACNGAFPMVVDTGVIPQCDFNAYTVTLPEGYKWSDWGFQVGDCLHIVNEDDPNPAPEGYYRLTEVRGRIATTLTPFFTTDKCDARFRREIPDLDRVCVNGRRVYGVAGKELYISAEGCPMDFYSLGVADGRGPARLHSDTQGGFTACVPWQGYVVCFKRDRICKLLGTRADTFELQEVKAVGTPKELSATVCELAGYLYYASDSGVYRYRGQYPERIAPSLGQSIAAGCGGTDGLSYYVALRSEEAVSSVPILIYAPDPGAWYTTDNRSVPCMMGANGFLWMQDEMGNIRVTSSDGRDAGYPPDSFPLVAVAELETDRFEPDACRPLSVCIRATGAAGSILLLGVQYMGAEKLSGGEYDPTLFTASLEGDATEQLWRVALPPRTCDQVRIRLSLLGEWVIHSVTREYGRVERM